MKVIVNYQNIGTAGFANDLNIRVREIQRFFRGLKKAYKFHCEIEISERSVKEIRYTVKETIRKV